MMDRRGFLKAAVAVPAASAIPFVITDDRLTATMIKNAITDFWTLAPTQYLFVVHPTIERQIRRIRALALWQDEHRKWRKEPGTESMEDLMRRVKDALETEHEWDIDALPLEGITGYVRMA